MKPHYLAIFIIVFLISLSAALFFFFSNPPPSEIPPNPDHDIHLQPLNITYNHNAPDTFHIHYLYDLYHNASPTISLYSRPPPSEIQYSSLFDFDFNERTNSTMIKTTVSLELPPVLILSDESGSFPIPIYLFSLLVEKAGLSMTAIIALLNGGVSQPILGYEASFPKDGTTAYNYGLNAMTLAWSTCVHSHFQTVTLDTKKAFSEVFPKNLLWREKDEDRG